jgi:hypothetical protein
VCAFRVQAAKPLQRAADADYEAAARAELRPDDPLAAYFASKGPDLIAQADARRLDAVHSGDLAGASGFSVPQAVPEHSWLRRGVAPLPNRCALVCFASWHVCVAGVSGFSVPPAGSERSWLRRGAAPLPDRCVPLNALAVGRLRARWGHRGDCA